MFRFWGNILLRVAWVGLALPAGGLFSSCSDRQFSFESEERRQARQELVGTQLATLAVGETIYSDVEIREVTPAGLRILHSKGVTNVALKDLPAQLQEAAMFDPAEAKAYLRAKRSLKQSRQGGSEEINLENELDQLPAIPEEERMLNQAIEREILLSHGIQDQIQATMAEAAALTRNSAKWKSKWQHIRELELERSRHEAKVRKAKRLLAEKELVRRKREQMARSR
ncbi:MAG: hypothetical protein R3F19_03435 [Verrucomicrobiales bacterium]